MDNELDNQYYIQAKLFAILLGDKKLEELKEGKSISLSITKQIFEKMGIKSDLEQTFRTPDYLRIATGLDKVHFTPSNGEKPAYYTLIKGSIRRSLSRN